ncbi:hypothetical protein [Kibdelosporangium philippinense]|uniref:hypothetical protein n=1 Tax=Kibdelosporangium philippinense TaxID=211113 RepID=UPI003621974C
MNVSRLADVVVRTAPTRAAANEIAELLLADLPGCVLVVVDVVGAGVLLAARPTQRVLVVPGDVLRIAAVGYESLLRGEGRLESLADSSSALGSPPRE